MARFVGNVMLISLDAIERDLSNEKRFGIQDIKFYAYQDTENRVVIIGQLIGNHITQDFGINLTLYDSDGDVLYSDYSEYCGASCLVTHVVKKSVFFDGYPFMFKPYVNVKLIARMKLSLMEE